ncbi:MAG: hypothetical protein IPN86_17530 [Saprospiraceae bacterium]|nr:hypothetical protein [Saprospiraceae bacterium]
MQRTLYTLVSALTVGIAEKHDDFFEPKGDGIVVDKLMEASIRPPSKSLMHLVFYGGIRNTFKHVYILLGIP